jgi:hypothetical protein
MYVPTYMPTYIPTYLGMCVVDLFSNNFVCMYWKNPFSCFCQITKIQSVHCQASCVLKGLDHTMPRTQRNFLAANHFYEGLEDRKRTFFLCVVRLWSQNYFKKSFTFKQHHRKCYTCSEF